MQLHGLPTLSTTGVGTPDRLTSDQSISSRYLWIQTDPAEANDVIVYGANGIKIGKCSGGGGTFIFPLSVRSQQDGEHLKPYDYTVEATVATTVYIGFEKRPAY